MTPWLTLVFMLSISHASSHLLISNSSGLVCHLSHSDESGKCHAPVQEQMFFVDRTDKNTKASAGFLLNMAPDKAVKIYIVYHKQSA